MLHTRLPDCSPTAQVSTHVALELWRLAAVLRFCTVPELRLATSSLCVLIFTARVLEANYDLSLIVGCRAERRIAECVNAERKQLIGALSL